ncbi:hypothetical protein ANN_25891 [Periplaneta americana]|uniref:Reverse transcriptase domain-containing protein n=1 Tax=Periplaneta americana TaxID=6978 RepID=A0ABQ8S4U0_PERAM|nr:hypothetical protein ANN_25891 [Periplaneta americana]
MWFALSKENRYTRTVLLTHNRVHNCSTDDQVIISNSEDNLQRGLYTLNKILSDFGMEISAKKSKVMAFLGQDPIRSMKDDDGNWNYNITESEQQFFS